MIRQCFACNTGIIFDTTSLADVGIDVQTVWPVYIPNKTPIVGPSPNAMEHYESRSLPPIRRRSTAFKADQKAREQRKIDKEKKKANEKEILLRNGTFDDDVNRLLELLPEQVEDHFDALQPVNDMLVQAKGWWALELWPVTVKVQKKAGEWEKKMAMNLGRYRPVQETEPKMHWTVKLRAERAGYRVKNDIAKDALWNLTA
jgi:hypothetical protein